MIRPISQSPFYPSQQHNSQLQQSHSISLKQLNYINSNNQQIQNRINNHPLQINLPSFHKTPQYSPLPNHLRPQIQFHSNLLHQRLPKNSKIANQLLHLSLESIKKQVSCNRSVPKFVNSNGYNSVSLRTKDQPKNPIENKENIVEQNINTSKKAKINYENEVFKGKNVKLSMKNKVKISEKRRELQGKDLESNFIQQSKVFRKSGMLMNLIKENDKSSKSQQKEENCLIYQAHYKLEQSCENKRKEYVYNQILDNQGKQRRANKFKI